MFQVMLACWQEDADSRRSMKELHQDLKEFGSDDMESIYAVYRFIQIFKGGQKNLCEFSCYKVQHIFKPYERHTGTY